MHKTFADRLEYLISESSMGIAGLSEATENIAKRSKSASSISTSSLRNYLKGESEPKMSGAQAIADACNINLEWLSTGRGSILREDLPPVEVLSVTQAGEKLLAEKAIEVKLSKQRAGASSIRRLYLNREWLKSFGCETTDLIPVHNESYILAPTINQGDILLVDRTVTTQSEGVFLVVFRGTVDFRRLVPMPDGSTTVIFDNEVYPNFNVNEHHENQMIILGQVQYVWRGMSL